MYSTRLIHLLLVALGLVAAVQATHIDNRSPAKGPALQVRQDEGGTSQAPSGTPSAAPSETGGGATEPTQTPDPTTEQTTTNAPPTTSNQAETTPTPSDTPTPTPTPSDPATTPSTSQQTTEGNNQQTTTNNNNKQETTTTPEPSTWTTVIVVHSTAENGDVVSYTSPSQIVSTPTLSANEDNTGGGMPTATRNIVIGVVGGVGGAIVLGALGFVAWRIWGRKRKNEENDGLMDYHTAGTSAFGSEPKTDAASSTAASRSPFQTTLEDYHRPGQVNASSNF